MSRILHVLPRVTWWYTRLVRRMSVLFFFMDTATTEIYTLSLHDALPISKLTEPRIRPSVSVLTFSSIRALATRPGWTRRRSEEHTSELQSRVDLVCRLLLEKKKKEQYRKSR